MKPTTNRLLVKVEEKKKGKELEAATSIMTGKVLKKGPDVGSVIYKSKRQVKTVLV